jgi:thioredoxin reductase
MDFDVIIVGAGPYGLSCAAHLKAQGLGVGVFGEAMSFWQNHMPAGMYLRSNWVASFIADPQGKLTLDHFKADTGAEFEQPVPLEHFVAYGKWYQEKAVPDLCRMQVSAVERNGNGFRVTLGDGAVVKAKRVVVATGIAPFPSRPKEFDGLPAARVTHSSDHKDLSDLREQQVLVVGGGQSALDAARILAGYGGRVEIAAKQKELNWVGQHSWLHHLGIISWCLYSNYDVGPAGLSRLVGFPNAFRRLPPRLRNRLSYRATRPAGTGWQRPSLAKVPMTMNCRVTRAEMLGEQVRVQLDNGTERRVDHVILATGYRVDTSRFGFFGESVRQDLKTVAGYPALGRGLESSIPGLHFVGKPAAWSFGPLLNFVSGSHFAATELLKVV